VPGGKLHDAWCLPIGLQNVSQAGLEPASGGVAAILFSQCNVAWRSFPQARGSGCRSFDSPCFFISAKCGSSVSAMFWSLRAHAVCFCALVAILDPPGQFLVCSLSPLVCVPRGSKHPCLSVPLNASNWCKQTEY
jgi:hypothetical protein